MPKIMYKDKNYSLGSGSDIKTDEQLNKESINPVQNKTITEALDNKLNTTDISDWAKAKIKPEYTANEVGADKVGSANSALENAKSYTDIAVQKVLNDANEYTDIEIANLINEAPTTLDTLGEIAEEMNKNKSVVEALNSAIGSKASATDLISHVNNKQNPHDVNKEQIGLGNVDNTADSVKNVATATTASKLSTTMVGTNKNPVYFMNGIPVACEYELNKTVPSTAVFTDTNTAKASSTAIIGSASNWLAGSLPSLGTVITADDITAWNAGTAASASVSKGILTITNGTVPNLTYTARNIPNVTSVGSLPSLTITNTTVVTGVSI